MRHSRGKLIALGAAGLACAVLVAAGIAGRERILEEWYAHVLESGSEEEKLHAAEKLAEMGSGRGAEWLFEEARREYAAGFERRTKRSELVSWFGDPHQYLGKRGERLLALLVKTGSAALPTVIRGLASTSMQDLARHSVALMAFMDIEPELFSGRPEEKEDRKEDFTSRALRLLSEDPARPAEVRDAAAETLRILRTNTQNLNFQPQSAASKRP